MNKRKLQFTRMHALLLFLGAVLCVYVGVLFNIQIVHHEEYLAQSTRSITREEKVEAARGIITDRTGKTLVSNRSTYSLTFDASLLEAGQDKNEAILRLLELCKAQGVDWEDNLPISDSAPFTFTLDALSSLQKGRFLSYLRDLEPAREALEDLLSPAASDPPAAEQTRPQEDARDQEEAGDTQDAAPADPVDALTAQDLTTQLLSDAGITPQKLMAWMRQDMEVPETYTDTQARMVLGVRYELALRSLGTNVAYVLCNDIDTAFISILSDGNYAGAKISSSSVREYHTTYAAHILGTVGRINDMSEVEDLPGSYDLDDWVGKSGSELAFEEYLKGQDGRRVVSTNSSGKVTGEYFSEEPQPGNTVELTVDLDLQAATEDALAAAVEAMNEEDGEEESTRGAGAAVIKVGTGEVLSLASYPTFNLSTYSQDIAQLNTDPAYPLMNRATSGTYPPGSTFKPLTAAAALEEGVITLTEKLRDPGYWIYPDIIEGGETFTVHCWKRSGHGSLDITEAITSSCNSFFCELGYRLGIDKIDAYATAFGLGQSTGIEIGDKAGILAGPEEREARGGVWYGGDTVQAAFGQSDHLFTPIQLANYIATLVSGGKHCQAHLLKAVKSSQTMEVLATGNTDPLNTISISDSTLEAVKKGMKDLTTTTLAPYFSSCVVDAGAKTGTAQLGGDSTDNGVFVCFAPYDDPEIAVAIVIEKGGSGAALASTAVEILNAYFSADESGSPVAEEDTLLP